MVRDTSPAIKHGSVLRSGFPLPLPAFAGTGFGGQAPRE